MRENKFMHDNITCIDCISCLNIHPIAGVLAMGTAAVDDILALKRKHGNNSLRGQGKGDQKMYYCSR